MNSLDTKIIVKETKIFELKELSNKLLNVFNFFKSIGNDEKVINIDNNKSK